jgi:hypothetical protein
MALPSYSRPVQKQKVFIKERHSLEVIVDKESFLSDCRDAEISEYNLFGIILAMNIAGDSMGVTS